MSFLKSLFSPVMQRATVIEHLIETLARKDDHCEWVEVLKFEQLQEYMVKNSASVVVAFGTYPDERIVHRVRISAVSYDVLVSRAVGGRGVTLTSKFAGTDDFSEVIEQQAQAERDSACEDDAVRQAIDIAFRQEGRPAIVKPLRGKALRRFFLKNSLTGQPDWITSQNVIFGAAICAVDRRGACLIMVGQSITRSYVSAQEMPAALATPDKIAEAPATLREIGPNWIEALTKLESQDLPFDALGPN